MRHYEIMLLIRTDCSEQVPDLIERYQTIIQSKAGVIHRLENLGRRDLQYPLKKQTKVHDLLINIECDLATLQELEESFTFNDAIINYLLIKQKGAITEPSLLTPEGRATREAQSKAHTKEKTQSPTEAQEDDADTSTQTDHDITAQDNPETSPPVRYVAYKRRRNSHFANIKPKDINYKDPKLIECMTETYKIEPCRNPMERDRNRQRAIALAIKRARIVGLLPHCDKYVQPNIR